MDTAISQVEKLSYFMYQDEVLEIINSTEISPAEKAHQSNVLALKYKTWETMLDFDLDINNIYYIAHTVHIPPFHALCTNSRAQASLSITSSREGCAMYAAASTAFII